MNVELCFLKVFLAMILGSNTVEKTSPNIQSFTTARGAAYKIYSIIDQVRQGNWIHAHQHQEK